MLKQIIILFLLFAYLPQGWALDYWDTLDDSSESNILEKKEVHLNDENLISKENEHGIVTRKYFSGHDSTKFYFSGHVSEDLAYASELFGFEAAMAKKIKWFWGHLFLSHHEAKFKAISENRSNGANVNNIQSEQNYFREDNSAQKLNTLGLGLGLRHKLKLDFLKTDKIFQSVVAYLTYNELDETYRNVKYLGPGLRTDFALEHRLGPTFAYGPALTYNLAIVSRGTVGTNEENNDRRLYLSYLTLCLQLGFYF